MRRLVALLITVAVMLSAMVPVSVNAENTEGHYVFAIDGNSLGETLPNFASNVNVWQVGNQFINPVRNDQYDIFEFVEYVQLMQVSGGNESRDLFKDPLNRSVLDDYDFSNLIANCKGILSLGAKPCLKLGSVPLKYTTDPEISRDFQTNINPPDDYDVYYTYIAALAQALVDEFGQEEVLTWHFGVMTEFENGIWFKAKSGDSTETSEAYFKLYDYTVAALQNVIGEEVYVGAHSMTDTEGLWDENLFVKHCANGVNYYTGEKGTRLCYVAASSYETAIGIGSGSTVASTMRLLKRNATRSKLDVEFGVDEGRILGGIRGAESDALLTRSTGYTWQAAYDARMYGDMWDAGAHYFSYWGYLSEGLLEGFPTVSYHVSKLIARYKDANRLTTELISDGSLTGAEVEAYAAYDKDTSTLRCFVYNFKDTLAYTDTAHVQLQLAIPQFSDGEVTITQYRIDDECNWFDEWQQDRITYNITDDCFSWSPEDGNMTNLVDERARKLYEDELKAKYSECAVLTPTSYTAPVSDGLLTLNIDVAANTVVFFEINE